jgi:glycosyltransferase 2 family protein
VSADPVAAKWIKLSVAMAALSAAAYLFVGAADSGRGWISTLTQIGGSVLGLMLALSMVNYLLRFCRWHFFLTSFGVSIAVRDNLRIYFAGFSLTATPGKIGELARSVWLKPYGIPASHSIAVSFAERVLDLLIILLLALMGLANFPQWRGFLLAGLIGGVLALLTFYNLNFALLWHGALVRRPGTLRHFVLILDGLIEKIRICLTPSRIAIGIGMGFVAWGAEAVAFGLLLHVLDSPVPFLGAVAIYSVSMLVGAISGLPGGIGGTEVTMITLLNVGGVPMPVAGMSTVFIRLSTLWFAVLLGFVALCLQFRVAHRPPSRPP